MNGRVPVPSASDDLAKGLILNFKSSYGNYFEISNFSHSLVFYSGKH